MSESKSPDAPITPERIFQLAWGFAPTLMLHAAIENRIFDSLDAGPKNIDELAAATGASKRGLRAVVNSFVGFGLILRKGDRYTLAPDTATFLVSTKPAFLGGMIDHLSKQLLDNFRHLPEIIRTGKPASAVNTQNQGAEFFSKFVECLFNLNYAPACALGEKLAKDLPAGKINILDIAAGSGVWGIGVAQRLPTISNHRRRLAHRPPRHAPSRRATQSRRSTQNHRRRYSRRGFRKGLQRRHPRPHPPQRRRKTFPPPPEKSLRRPRPRRRHRHRRIRPQRRPHRATLSAIVRRQHARPHRRRRHLYLQTNDLLARRNRLPPTPPNRTPPPIANPRCSKTSIGNWK